MHEIPHARLVAYGVAVLCPAISLLVRWPLWPVLEDHLPHMTFLPAVALAAYYGGLRPGLLATVLSALAAVYFLLTTETSLQLSEARVAVGFCLFVLTGAILSGLSESLHRARDRILIDERKRAEQVLRESEERFRHLAENIHEIYWTIDARKDHLIYVSPAFEEASGRSRQSLYEHPHSFQESIHPDDREAAAVHERRARQGIPTSWEFRVVRPDGAIRWLRNRAFPILDRHGDLSHLAGLAEDITEQKSAQEASSEGERRWRCLAEALPQLVWSALPDGACDYFSTQWTQHTGVAEGDLLGWSWLSVLHPEDRDPTRRAWTESLTGRTPYDVEYRVRRHDGEYRWFKTRGVSLRDGMGAISKWFGTCTDVTDSKRQEAELRRAMEAAEAANHAKDEFLANVSHEIRTPMNAILGMTELALDTPLTEYQRQCLTTVKSAANNLLGMIDDLLDFAKIEAGKLELDPADFSLRAALGDTLRALAVRRHEKGLELVSHVQPAVPDALVGDAGRLRQILLNLIGNAIKFTDEGEVVVRVETADDTPAASAAGVCFEVTDTGIGIPQDKQARIFRAFEQEDASTTKKYGGTGLGLTIASRLVTLMGGNIVVDSEPGKGSRFSFTARFGLQPTYSQPIAARPPVVPRDLRVLIVDDNATNRHILQEWLCGWQMEAATAGDGMAALDALWHGVAVGRPYALALLDGRMPDTDGLALAARIRERAELSSTRIILLTSGDLPGDLSRSRALHVSAHLLKPIQQEELFEAIHRTMSRPEEDRAAGWEGNRVTEKEADPAVPRRAGGLRVLVAEDNEFNAQLMEQLLVRKGHHMTLANDGRMALSLAEEGGFDLMLLDVHMPELDGFGVIRAIRERERSADGHLPVIALTARSRREDRERCLAAGMDDYLAKPLAAADLWASIDRVVARTQAGRPRPGLLDPRVLLATCGGDDAILGKITEAFRARLPGQLTAVRDAMQDYDPARLREAAHKLSGIVSAFSTVTGAVASDLEDQAAGGRLTECRPLVGRLEAMAQELIELAGGLSIERLRQQTGAADFNRTGSP